MQTHQKHNKLKAFGAVLAGLMLFSMAGVGVGVGALQAQEPNFYGVTSSNKADYTVAGGSAIILGNGRIYCEPGAPSVPSTDPDNLNGWAAFQYSAGFVFLLLLGIAAAGATLGGIILAYTGDGKINTLESNVADLEEELEQKLDKKADKKDSKGKKKK